MAHSNQVFQRVEKKYLLTKQQFDALLERIKPYMCADQYGEHTICNVYYDTKNYDLIRRSVDKPVYKEKFRIRSYGTPQADDKIFLEIKKKYKGTVYKRRASMKYSVAMNYLENGVRPKEQSQILREIEYFIDWHNISPKLYLAYDRVAFFGREDEQFRMTFDTRIRSREDHLRLDYGDHGKPLLEDGNYLLEIKVNNAIPLWMAHTLSDLNIFPVSFSKYGNIYSQKVLQNRICSVTSNYHEITEDKECLKVLSN